MADITRGMNDQPKRATGGCLCGAVRYEATGEPLWAGLCCCVDCRKTSGSGYIPFIGYSSSALTFIGETRQALSTAASGGGAVRNFCPVCGSLVFGGIVGTDAVHTIYAGSLDDPSLFQPTVAIFNKDRPSWVVLPRGITIWEKMPG